MAIPSIFVLSLLDKFTRSIITVLFLLVTCRNLCSISHSQIGNFTSDNIPCSLNLLIAIRSEYFRRQLLLFNILFVIALDCNIPIHSRSRVLEHLQNVRSILETINKLLRYIRIVILYLCILFIYIRNIVIKILSLRITMCNFFLFICSMSLFRRFESIWCVNFIQLLRPITLVLLRSCQIISLSYSEIVFSAQNLRNHRGTRTPKNRVMYNFLYPCYSFLSYFCK